MGIRLLTFAATLLVAAGLRGEPAKHPPTAADAERATESLRQITRELTDAVRRFNAHLGQEIARHDRGYRLEDRTQVSGADADLVRGPADLMSAATQKFTVFRMLAVRDDTYDPAAAADLLRIQELIQEARRRSDAGTDILRRQLVVSAKDLDPNRDALIKQRRDELLTARADAADAAKRALLAFPFDQTETCAQEETAQRAWDRLGNAKKKAPAIPVRFERRKRITLLNEMSYRMAITDAGIEDEEGRHIFYQEEWVQRGPSVIRLRWRVGVDTESGEHVLLRRYPPVEGRGELTAAYNRRDRDYLWYLEPPENSVEPTGEELAAALAGVARSREVIHAAIGDYRAGVREALAQQDRASAAANEPTVDAGLPDEMRMRLFAMRAHVARVTGVLQLERMVRGSVGQAEEAIRGLEPLAAWSNREDEKGPMPERADTLIDAVRDAESEAVSALPVESTQSEETFPAIERNLIVRIRLAASRNAQGKALKCIQEIWRMEGGNLGGLREVRRAVSLILIDPQTGKQTSAGSATRYYKAAPEDLLEEVYDEYAADEVVKIS